MDQLSGPQMSKFRVKVQIQLGKERNLKELGAPSVISEAVGMVLESILRNCV